MTRVLIIVFDALRPEFVTHELMPNLNAFAAAGVRCASHHSTFPTETRVNQSAVITGCYPHRHGVVANNFPLPGTEEVVRTGDDLAFEAMLNAMDGPLLEAPALGGILAENGRSFATISAGTSGGGRLINMNAEAEGSIRYTLRRPEVSIPSGFEEQVAAKVGPIPEYQRPAVEWNRHAVDAWLDVIDPREPDVSLLWLCEPDESFHWHGIGSPESLEAIRGVDAAFGEILARKTDAIEDGSLQIIAMSDHGQVSLAGAKIGLEDRMRSDGFDFDGSPPDYVVSVHNAGGIWVRDSDPGLIARAVEWLEPKSWIGPLFTREGIAGTLRHADLCVDHARAPDIYLSLSSANAKNQNGVVGLCADNAPYPIGGGCHGGLSRYELRNVLTLGGSAFATGLTSVQPTGNVDILPTVLHLLGVPIPPDIDGRILTEAFPGGTGVAEADRFLVGTGRTRLSFTQTGDTRYFERAWTDVSRR